MRLDLVKEFILLSQVKNYSKAADMLYLDQSVLSKHMSKLENELQSKLFIRTYPLELTDAGAFFLKAISPIMADLDVVINKTKLIENGYIGELNVGILYYAKEQIISYIKIFEMKYPKIKLNYFLQTPNELMNAILRDEIDIARVHMIDDEKNALLLPFETHRIHTGKLTVLVHTENKLSSKRDIHISDVQNENCIVVDDNYYRQYFRSIALIASKYGVVLKKVTFVPTYEDYLFKILLNQGIGFGTDNTKTLLNRNIVRLSIFEEDFTYSRYLIWCKSNQNQAISKFVDLFK